MAACRAPAEVREFTKKDGEAVFGEIIDYNPQTDKVKIRTDNRKMIQMKAASFRDEDFIYIRDWDAVRLFSNNNNFRIYLSGPESKNKWTKYLWRRYVGKIEPTHTYTIDFNKMGYTIKFENQTGYDLENVATQILYFL